MISTEKNTHVAGDGAETADVKPRRIAPMIDAEMLKPIRMPPPNIYVLPASDSNGFLRMLMFWGPWPFPDKPQKIST